MKKTTWKSACALGTALCLLVVTQAMGQARQAGQDASQPRTGQQRAGQQKAGQHKVCLSSKLTKMMVKDKSNQSVGQIQDLLIDESGKVQYLAISTQGQAGTTPRETPATRPQPGARTGQVSDQNAKLTLVPFDAVEIHEGETATQNYASLNIDKDQIAQAPSFTRQQLTSQTGQAQWMSQVNQFFQKTGAARPNLDRENQKQNQKQNQDRERE